MKLSRRTYLLLIISGVAATISVAVYASVSQISPAIIVPSIVFATKSNCSTITWPSTVPPTSGTLVGNCVNGNNQIPAFTVNRDGSSTPTFSLPSDTGILTLSLGIAPDGSGCGSGIRAITSGTPVSFTSQSGWIYCLTYTASPSGGT
ncbi:hypothetical protein J2P12_07305, partial [Candidatus Bathyarchaeota archaeon]|nr:hypothetical protein [Candidatus Bathyarchaeota archaeon]